MGSGDNKVLVLADDFTGANDAGVSLAETGMRAEVAFSASYQGEAQALILNSDSRAQPAAEAARRITHLLQAVLPRFQPRWTVKKIDSTLRGNLGAELEATMRALNCAVAVLAPAFPAAGRVTRRGVCYVHGSPVNETEFATDPKTPVSSADIAAVVAQQSDLLCRGTTVPGLAAELEQTVETPRRCRRKPAAGRHYRHGRSVRAAGAAGGVCGAMRRPGASAGDYAARPAAGGGRFNERNRATAGCPS